MAKSVIILQFAFRQEKRSARARIALRRLFETAALLALSLVR